MLLLMKSRDTARESRRVIAVTPPPTPSTEPAIAAAPPTAAKAAPAEPPGVTDEAMRGPLLLARKSDSCGDPLSRW